MKKEVKEQAIALRREGKTYREILDQVPIAKSTLSDWLRSVELSVPQKQRITQKRISAALRGAHAKRAKRYQEIAEFNSRGKEEVGKITDRELWLIGTALYWAEGSKQHESSSPSAPLIFTNSDPWMSAIFLRWLEALGVDETRIIFDIYVHENRKGEIQAFKLWWSRHLGITPDRFSSVYLKKDKILTNRKNIADLYHGLIRIRVRSSASLNRQVQGWVSGIVETLN